MWTENGILKVFWWRPPIINAAHITMNHGAPGMFSSSILPQVQKIIMTQLILQWELVTPPWYFSLTKNWSQIFDFIVWRWELGAFCTCDMSSTYFIVDLTSCWDRLHHSCAVRFLLWKNCLTSHLVGSPMLTLGWLVPLVIRIDSVSISCCLPCHLNSAYF